MAPGLSRSAKVIAGELGDLIAAEPRGHAVSEAFVQERREGGGDDGEARDGAAIRFHGVRLGWVNDRKDE